MEEGARDSRAGFEDAIFTLAPEGLGSAQSALGRTRLRTFITLRWLAVGGQTSAVLLVYFGLGFQLPLVMLFLSKIGIFDADAYASQWRMAVLVFVVVSALLTPADPYSMLFLALPLCLLYFGGLAICRWTSSTSPA
jgi:hypothetical protein